MTLPTSTNPTPQQEPDRVQERMREATSKDRTRSGRTKGFLNANGVERSTQWMAIGLAVIAFLVLSILGRGTPPPDQSDVSPNVIAAPVIPLPDGDIGGVSQEVVP